MKVKKLFLLAVILLMSMASYKSFAYDVKVANADGVNGNSTEGTVSSWKNIVLNSDLEGNDVSSFYSRENLDMTDELLPATILNGIGVDNSRGIMLQSVDNPSESWTTQFFLRLPQTLPVGTRYRLSFDCKASQDAHVNLEAHAEPSEYIFYYFGGMWFEPSWQHYEAEGIITKDMRTDELEMRTIAFDLSEINTATTYYLDNIVFEIDQNSAAVIANDLIMSYGDDVPTLTYDSYGAKLEGTPKLSTPATNTSPVGYYPIMVEKGTLTNEDLTLLDGLLYIERAPLTVGVQDVTITEGDAIPDFTLTYSGWRNGDTEDNAFITKPIISTTATSFSQAGTYPIIINDGEASNYNLSYMEGTLTIKSMAKWKNIVMNSGLEGNDVSCFYSRENLDVADELQPATILNGIGVDNSRGIMVQSVDNPSESWTTQFFLRLPQTLPVGTRYRLSFDCKASQDAHVNLEAHAEPSEYIFYNYIYGGVWFTPSWQHYEAEGIITEDMRTDELEMRTIAFDLSEINTATIYYLDNIVFEIDQAQLEQSVLIKADETSYARESIETILEKTKTMTLKATVYPLTLEDKSVTWESSDTKIATVTSSGEVLGVKAGTATITCTSVATGAKATCKLTVGYVKLDKTEAILKNGDAITLTSTVYPSKLEDRSVTWTSSDETVTTVTSSGKVKGVKPGIATITCTSNATGLSTNCTVTVMDLSLDLAEAILEKFKTMTLTPLFYPETLSDKSVTWESSDTKIATVTSSGEVLGVKAGTATITCTSVATGAKATCKLTVGYVKLDNTEAILEKGETVTLTPTVYPSKLEDRSVTWTSSDETVATVMSSGKVKGVKAGAATITCTSNATGLSTTCKVTVNGVSLDKYEAILEKTKTMKLKALVYPETLSDRSVTWKSSDTKIATVTSNGEVKGVKAGTATITCTSVATGATATCKLTVGYVKLDMTETTLEKGKTMTLISTVYPSKLEDRSVTWESSDETVATVTSSGEVKGIEIGTATITCTSNATGLSTTCMVTVSGISLDKTEAILEKGKTMTLKPTFYPEIADKSVTWKSSNTAVATVSSTGKIKGVKAGIVTITCTSVATGATATCNLTVGYVKLDKTEAILEKFKTMTLEATVYPSKLEDRSVTWESSDTKIATVTSSGEVEGIKAGTATITCTSNATGLSTTCKVTVGYVKLDKTEVAIKKNKTVALTATVYPSKLEDRSVTWKSSDETVATVTSSGKVKGIKYGIATITCTSNATGLSTTCQVTVGTVALNISEVTIHKGMGVTLMATAYPETLEDKSVTWESSDETVVTVTSSGKVTGINTGTATITCTSAATGLSAVCNVTVIEFAGARFMYEDDAYVTGIEAIDATPAVEEPFDVYDLRGRKVLHRVTSLDGLPAGVYIVNGKKVLKR